MTINSTFIKKYIPVLILLAVIAFSCINNKSFLHAEANQQEDLKSLVERLSMLETKISADEQKRELHESTNRTAILVSSRKGTWTIHTEDGDQFMIALGEIKKYPTGYKVTLNIGNPHYIEYTGMKLYITWGRPGEIRGKEIGILKPILPGVMNEVDVILSPAKEDEISFITVTVLGIDGSSFLTDVRLQRD